jgi:hypothetical protein
MLGVRRSLLVASYRRRERTGSHGISTSPTRTRGRTSELRRSIRIGTLKYNRSGVRSASQLTTLLRALENGTER